MISVSFLKSKYDNLTTLKMIDESISDFIHVDLMDGIYVENKNFEVDELIDLLKDVNKPLDIHLMVNNPIEYISKLSLLHPSVITFHVDATNDVMGVINTIKDYNIKVGIAINPKDSIDLINEYISYIDYVLVLAVNPGMGGQKFIPSVIDKIELLKKGNVMVGIDGGINNETIKLLKNYKIDIVVSGSYICMSDNYNDKINELKKYSN